MIHDRDDKELKEIVVNENEQGYFEGDIHEFRESIFTFNDEIPAKFKINRIKETDFDLPTKKRTISNSVDFGNYETAMEVMKDLKNQYPNDSDIADLELSTKNKIIAFSTSRIYQHLYSED